MDCLTEPLIAETVSVYTPVLAVLDAVNFTTLLPEPGAAMLDGVTVPVTPLGNPLNVNATAALNPPLTVTLVETLLFDPSATVIALEASAA